MVCMGEGVGSVNVCNACGGASSHGHVFACSGWAGSGVPFTCRCTGKDHTEMRSRAIETSSPRVHISLSIIKLYALPFICLIKK